MDICWCHIPTDICWCHTTYLQRMGKKIKITYSSVHCNTRTTGNGFFAHNSSLLPTTIQPKALFVDLFPSLYFTYLFYYQFPFVLRPFHHRFLRSDLELLSHTVGCAAQPYQSAVLSLSVIKGSFIPFTELEDERLSWWWIFLSWSRVTEIPHNGGNGDLNFDFSRVDLKLQFQTENPWFYHMQYIPLPRFLQRPKTYPGQAVVL